MKERYLFNGSYIPALTAYDYRDHIISAWARPEFGDGFTSIGIVYKRDQLGSLSQVQRIEGELFDSEERAERHGIALCKGWVDTQLSQRRSEAAKRSA
jgi:hypothetical protein